MKYKFFFMFLTLFWLGIFSKSEGKGIDKRIHSPNKEFYVYTLLDDQSGLAVFETKTKKKIQQWSNIEQSDIVDVEWVGETTFKVKYDNNKEYEFTIGDSPKQTKSKRDGNPLVQCDNAIRLKPIDCKKILSACDEDPDKDLNLDQFDNKRRVLVYGYRGICYSELDNYAQAVEAFQQAAKELQTLETETPLQILIPLYNYPARYDESAYFWDDVADANKHVPITVIINPGNGPGNGEPNNDYQQGLKTLRDAGVTILGYVYTSYGERDIQEVEADVDIYNQYFDINGIFFDEVANSSDKLDYYEKLYHYINNLSHLDKIFLNPGTTIGSDYFSQLPDATIVISENTSNKSTYQPDDALQTYPAERFAMLIHTVTDVETMKSSIDAALQHNIGYVYLTNDTMPNPWDTLPEFWNEEIEYIASKNSESVADTPDASQAIERYKGSVLRIVQTETEVIAKNISDAPVEIRIAWDTGHDTYLDNWVEPGESVAQNINNHKSVMVLAWGSSNALVDEFEFLLQAEVLYNGKVLLITQAISKITVQNISDSPIAIRMSWDDKDPDGSGAKGSDSYLDNWVEPGELVEREIMKHTSIQSWAWDSSGALVDSFSSPPITKDEPSLSDIQYEGNVLFDEGNVLFVTQTDSEIIVKNISDFPVAIRISWDGGDPFGTGRGEDSFIDNWVPPGERVTRPFNEHTSTQIWSWDSSTALVDSCDLTLSHQ
ncbi:MAG: hypothetical protein GY797_00780 [Deltaproteobacteria bacterium]|nr:hypothetical protein [Deltaproteobacteria bacterium]